MKNFKKSSKVVQEYLSLIKFTRKKTIVTSIIYNDSLLHSAFITRIASFAEYKEKQDSYEIEKFGSNLRECVYVVQKFNAP